MPMEAGRMEKRYSEMSEFELHQEISQLNEKAKKAEQMGMASELAVYERKMAMAKSYLLNPDDYQPEEVYELIEGGDTFKISYLNGYFAWGYRNQENELSAVPISLLSKSKQ